MIKIGNNGLMISFHAPDGVEGYYRGTRFDWAGNFSCIEYRGCNYAEPWFENYSPIMHDAVCGPTEEFSPIGVENAAAGEPFLKIGVGMLKRLDDQPYDRFRLHEIADPGERSLEITENYVSFGHRINSETGYGYEYIKNVEITSDCSFRISHKLKNTGEKPLKGDVYNHNFFTMGLLETGSSRRLDFPFKPEGDWRAEYSEVGFTESGIRFTRTLQKGESVFTGNLHEAGKGLAGSPNAFILSEDNTGRTVEMTCAAPMTKAVFWSNHRIACYEPYIDFDIAPGEIFEWEIEYKLK